MVIKVKIKSPWDGSSLWKDANVPPHQSHAVNCLPLTHKPLWLPPLPQASPSDPFQHCGTFSRQNMTSTRLNPLLSRAPIGIVSMLSESLPLRREPGGMGPREGPPPLSTHAWSTYHCRVQSSDNPPAPGLIHFQEPHPGQQVF